LYDNSQEKLKTFVVELSVINGLDALARLIITLRKGRMEVKEVNVRSSNGILLVRVILQGLEDDVQQIVKKIENMYEVSSVECTPYT